MEVKAEKPDIVGLINIANQNFLNNKSTVKISEYFQFCEIENFGKKYCFFGIDKNNQNEECFRSVRSLILQKTGNADIKDTVQVLGSSKPYSKDATKKAKMHIKKFLRAYNDCAILYGFTGSVDSDGGADINQCVNDLIEGNPEMASKIFANIVYDHTCEAISKWGCTYSQHVCNFILVYSRCPSERVLFGDDTYTSDNLTTKAALCVEGGIQSFRQSLFLLRNNVKVEGVCNIDAVDTTFSAAVCLNYMRSKYYDSFLNSKADFNALSTFNMYLKSMTKLYEQKADSATKLPLLELAKVDMLSENIWQKIASFFECVDYKSFDLDFQSSVSLSL